MCECMRVRRVDRLHVWGEEEGHARCASRLRGSKQAQPAGLLLYQLRRQGQERLGESERQEGRSSCWLRSVVRGCVDRGRRRVAECSKRALFLLVVVNLCSMSRLYTV